MTRFATVLLAGAAAVTLLGGAAAKPATLAATSGNLRIELKVTGPNPGYPSVPGGPGMGGPGGPGGPSGMGGMGKPGAGSQSSRKPAGSVKFDFSY